MLQEQLQSNEAVTTAMTTAVTAYMLAGSIDNMYLDHDEQHAQNLHQTHLAGPCRPLQPHGL